MAREFGQPEIVVAGVVTQHREGLLHAEACALGDHPFGLFDDDATVKRVVELLVQDLALAHRALLQDGDGGDISKRLGNLDVPLFGW